MQPHIARSAGPTRPAPAPPLPHGRHRIVVDHGPEGPRQARSAVRSWIGDAGAHRLADDVLLIVSELVTNAVRHGAPPVQVEVSVDDRTVTVAVCDADPNEPVRRSAGTDAEGGRGLLLIDLLAVEAGVRPEPPGKAVWAALPLSS